jgi:hypothetical protein
MTEFPQLARALEEAAERQAHSSSRAPRLAAGSLAALVVALVVGIATSLPGDETERSAGPPPLTQLEESFAVFRRERRPDDALPKRRAGMSASLRTDESRLAAAKAGARLFLVPGRLGGRDELCALVQAPGVAVAGDFACAPIEAATDERTPLASFGAGGGVAWAVFPDGTANVQIVFDDKPAAAVELGENALLHVGDGLRGISWTGSSGERHRLGVGGPGPLDPPARPELDATDEVALVGARWSGRLQFDRRNGYFELTLSVDPPTGETSFAVWVDRESGPCLLGFMIGGEAQTSGRLPQLPAGTMLLVTRERSTTPQKPGEVVLSGLIDTAVAADAPAERLCRNDS